MQPDDEVEKLLLERENAGGDPAEGIWQHPGDYTLGGAARAGDEEKVIASRNLPNKEKAVQVYFDGGYWKEHGGAGGFVAFDPRGKCLDGMSLFFSTRAKSNNEAELMALDRVG